ncbi:MAG: RluA family pseudouridine synthase [Kiritimatiellae bacterium]|nr:RluA family pseudouridine synthase [Kiritimatiellia bacterium]
MKQMRKWTDGGIKTGRRGPEGLLKQLGRVRQNGTELLEFLVEQVGKGVSRRAVKGLLDDRLVFVNGRRIWMAKHLLQTRDVVEVHVDGLRRLQPSPAAGKGRTARNGGKGEPTTRATAGKAVKIRILAEGDGWLVVDKPPRMLTVGEKSLEMRLKEQLGEAGEGVRAVHRLDRDTSGCVLFAKTAEARAELIKEFAAGQVRKVYHALVAGIPEERQTEVRKLIDGLPAVSHVRVLSARRGSRRDEEGAAAHVAVAIETGRTHQIRIHLRQLGCPVLGDKEHFLEVSERFRGVGRQMLHAYGLRFRWHGQGVAVTAPLPRDFRELMRALGLT